MKKLIIIAFVLTACGPLDYLEEYRGVPPFDEREAIQALLDVYAENEPHTLTVDDISVGWIHEPTIPGYEGKGGVSTGCGDVWVVTGDVVTQPRYYLAHEIVHCYLSNIGRGLDGDHSEPEWNTMWPDGVTMMHYHSFLNWDPDIYE